MTGSDVTDSDIQTFTRKLEDFGNGLAPNERAILAEILVSAASAQGGDVEGHADLGMINVLVQHMRTAEWQAIVSQLHQLVHHVHHVTQVGVHPAHPGVQTGMRPE